MIRPKPQTPRRGAILAGLDDFTAGASRQKGLRMENANKSKLLADCPPDLRRLAGTLIDDLDRWLEVFAKHYGIREQEDLDRLTAVHKTMMDLWHGMLDTAPKRPDGYIDGDDPKLHRMMLTLEAAARTSAVFVQRLRYDLRLVPKHDQEAVATRQAKAIEKLNEQARALQKKAGKPDDVPPHLTLNVSPHSALALCSGVLMVLRHPGVQGLEVSGVCRSFVEGLLTAMMNAGLTAAEEVIDTQVEEFGVVTEALADLHDRAGAKVELLLQMVDLLEHTGDGWYVSDAKLAEVGLAEKLRGVLDGD